MTAGKIDDQLHSHPKPEQAGLDAMGLWVMCLSYCCAYLTDGFVTEARVQRIAGARGAALACKLVTAHLWETSDGGWRFHDWDDYQVLRADALLDRERRIAAGRKGGMSKAHALACARADARADGVASTEASAVASATQVLPGVLADTALARGCAPDLGSDLSGSVDLSQTDPDPDLTSHRARGGRRAGERGTRLPHGWRPSNDDAVAGVLQEFGIDRREHDLELDQFRDYWAGVVGKKGTKLDWDATFRNRLREQAQRGNIGGHFPAKQHEPPEPPKAIKPWLLDELPTEGTG